MVQFRFTIFNPTLAPAGIEVPQPDGWKTAQLISERHKKYHCLVRHFEADLVWYGSVLILLKQIKDTQGPSANVTLKIEFSEQIGLFETLIDGYKLDLSLWEGVSTGKFKYKAKIPLINTSAWVKFISRSTIPIDVLSAIDMDGNAIAFENKFTLALPSQTIKSTLDAKIENQSLNIRNLDYLVITDNSVPIYEQLDYSSLAIDDIIQLDIADIINLDEIKNRFSIPFIDVEDGKPAFFLTALYDGSYAINIRIEASIYSSTAANNGLQKFAFIDVELKDVFQEASPYFEIYFQVNNDTPILLATETSPLVLEKLSTYYTLNQTFNLKKNDSIRLYAKLIKDLDDLNDEMPVHPFDPPGTTLPPLGLGTLHFRDNINHLFFWGSNNSNLFLERYNFIHQVLVGDPEDFTSYYLFGADPTLNFDAGDPPSGLASPTFINIVADTTYEQTSTDCLLLKDVCKNLLSKITGIEDCLESDYLNSNQAYYALMRCKHIRGYLMDDKEFSLSFEDVWNNILDPILNCGLDFINGKFKIEKRSYFYKPETVISILNIPNINDSYAQDQFIKSVEYGYGKWSAESDGGIDDPQTKHNVVAGDGLLGTDYKQLSNCIAASLALEQTRRNRIEAEKDWRLDEDLAIIALKFTDPDYEVEVGSDFEAVVGLNNPDTRYNLRITPRRNFLRYLNNYNGSLLIPAGQQYKFSKGEGNYSASIQGKVDDPEGDSIIVENANVNVGSEFLKLPNTIKFKMPISTISYETIINNIYNSLALSPTNSNVLSYVIERIAYSIALGFMEFYMLQGFISEEAPVYRILEDGTIRELEDGTKRILE